MYKKFKKIIITCLFISVLPVQGAELIRDTEEVLDARVVSVVQVSEHHQDIIIDIENKDGSLGGRVSLVNDYVPLRPGDDIFVRKIIRADDGKESYSVADINRTGSYVLFGGLFIFLTILFGGKQGLRGVFSLLCSLLLIVFVLLPLVLAGYSALWVSIAVASIIIVFGSYVTHGCNRTTSSAVVGMILVVLLTGVLASIAVAVSRLSGLDSEDAIYLSFNTGKIIDFQGLLLGGFIIGLLGVLYDGAIGQAVSVEELWRVAPHLSRKEVFLRALRIGREHIGALVNTLAIAYVGVSLPTMLLFYGTAELPLLAILNREQFAVEIIRTFIGSIGLVLAVPVTTLVSIYMLKHLKEGKSSGVHSHHHHH